LTGDNDRAAAALIYQAAVDALMMAILALESQKDNLDWLSDDMLKKLYKVDTGVLGLYDPTFVQPKKNDGKSWWKDIASFTTAAAAVAAVIAAEIEVGNE
jgi:hypothetical protein